MKTACLIMAAGSGSRMGQNKALVLFRGRSLLEHVATTASTALDSQADPMILVITGAESEAVSREASRLKLRAAHNSRHAAGLMSSLQVGIAEIESCSDQVLILLVDQPLITASTIKSLLTHFADENVRKNKSLARPYFAAQPGHPCLIAKEHYAEILTQSDSDGGAAFLFKKYSDKVCRYPSHERGVVIDFDRPEDLEV